MSARDNERLARQRARQASLARRAEIDLGTVRADACRRGVPADDAARADIARADRVTHEACATVVRPALPGAPTLRQPVPCDGLSPVLVSRGMRWRSVEIDAARDHRIARYADAAATDAARDLASHERVCEALATIGQAVLYGVLKAAPGTYEAWEHAAGQADDARAKLVAAERLIASTLSSPPLKHGGPMVEADQPLPDADREAAIRKGFSPSRE